jgi:hypothetical protein
LHSLEISIKAQSEKSFILILYVCQLRIINQSYIMIDIQKIDYEELVSNVEKLINNEKTDYISLVVDHLRDIFKDHELEDGFLDKMDEINEIIWDIKPKLKERDLFIMSKTFDVPVATIRKEVEEFYGPFTSFTSHSTALSGLK